MLPALIGMIGRLAATEGMAAVAGSGATGGATAGLASRVQYQFNPATVTGNKFNPASITQSKLPPPLPHEIEKTSGLFEKMTDKLKGLALGIQIPIHSLPELTQTFVGTLTTFVRGIDDAAKPIQSLVRLANPAQAEAFDRAIKDAYAVIGRSLIPIMEAFTRSARKIGDAMAGLEPIMEPAMKKLAEFVDELSTGIAKAIADSPETFKLLSSAIQMAVEQTKVWIPLLEQQAQIMNMMMAPENLILGSGKGPGFDKNASSAGAAARQAQFVQPKQIADDMIKNALNMGVGAKKTDNQALNSIDDTLKKIRDGFEKWWNRNADRVDKTAETVSPAYGIWKRLTG